MRLPEAQRAPAAAAVVGIDIGGTKTHLAITRPGAAVQERTVATSGWRTRSPERDAAALAGLVREHFGEPALDLPLGVGAHGCDSTEQCRVLERALAARTNGPVRVVNDAELMPWSMGVPGGIGVVSGTGAIAVARDPRGELVTCGGWGWMLGDEGGASGLVREATKAVLAELDTGRTGDPLVPRLLAALGAGDGPELAMALTLSNSADAWGSHAGEVFAAADEGSAVALRVVDQAADHLALLVQRLLQRGIDADQVVAGGAVVQSQERLRTRFVELLAARRPELTVTVLDRPPVTGALALAAASTNSRPSRTDSSSSTETHP
ncbi:N-acetylglucosamine kinase [Streptacidiphilus sp. P02-A3a]|uniref:N-acetylglucosamine kinase n=1 Tax=Streptacidiphilus sp. P02-A3a TaxID=2704468 RepID=UPI0015FE1B01|nr:BadF/BadG/BcrA/BcrD ATPase family protein [Streptacidiphilus sp. P02-A3a]QMU71352.1 ATPase [Streptacidiphilus sp. P02-A3a]